MAERTRLNPFEAQAPLLPDAQRGVLIERAAPLRQALYALQRGGFLTVSAPPRSGVTTFLMLLRAQLRGAVHVDLANFAFADDPPRQAAAALQRELAALWPDVAWPALPGGISDVLSLARQNCPGEITVIFDGFDAWNDDASRKLVLALRAAYTEARTAGGARLSVITGSAMDLRDLTSSGRTSPLNIAQFIFLGDFSEAEVTSLFKHGLSGITAEEAGQWAQQAFHMAGGHPALTQMIGQRAFELCAEQLSAAEAWPQVLAAVKEEATQLLGSTIGLLAERVELRRTASRIYSGLPVPFDRIHRPIRDLVHLGLLRGNEQGLARPRNSLFEQVLAPALNLAAPHPSINLWMAGRETSVLTPSPLSQLTISRSTTDFQSNDPELTLSHVQEPPPGQSEADSARGTCIPGEECAPLLLPGSLVGGCRIVRKIGRGGMAEVYLARHVGLDADVAIKVMRVHSGQDRRIDQRFLREARAAAQLNHENVVQIRNVGREGDIQFIEMEYLAGGSLAQWLDSAPYKNFSNAVTMLRQAAAGLQAAHGKGIIHRDVKPDNLMLTQNGRVKVVDFGLAAVTSHEGSRLTAEGMIVGTPHYMAPEQWEGKPVNERSDIYSLGATFYHLLSGRPPFEGRKPIELIRNFATQEPILPQAYNPGIPRPLSYAIMKMIERESADRYANIRELLADAEGLGLLG